MTQGLTDEPAWTRWPLEPVVDRACEVEGVLGAGHRHVREPTFFSDVPLTIRWGCARQLIGKAEGVQAGLAWEPLVGRVREEDHGELEALRLVDAEHVHLLVRGLEVRGDRIVAGFAKQLEMRDEK